jgi:hypothetical protein
MNTFTGKSKILRYDLARTHRREMMNAFRQFAFLCAAVAAFLLQPVLLGNNTLLVHGQIYTGNPKEPWVHTLAITGTSIDAAALRAYSGAPFFRGTLLA